MCRATVSVIQHILFCNTTKQQGTQSYNKDVLSAYRLERLLKETFLYFYKFVVFLYLFVAAATLKREGLASSNVCSTHPQSILFPFSLPYSD